MSPLTLAHCYQRRCLLYLHTQFDQYLDEPVSHYCRIELPANYHHWLHAGHTACVTAIHQYWTTY